MPRLYITDAVLSDLIRQLAPLVEGATGWDLQVASLDARVLPKQRAYEEIVLGRLQGAGIPLDDDAPRSLVERLVEYVVEANVLAAYQPAAHELLVVRENVDDSNLDGLRLVVAHELVHRGQHLKHGELFERVDAVMRELFQQMCRGEGNLERALQTLEQVQPVMTLLESHAYYIQETLRRQYFPAAEIESHLTLPALLMRLFGASKISQYTDGLPAIASAAAAGDVESLYAKL